MATATKICKVCGKEYEYCHTFRKDGNIFRWQDVACCPEHGSIYFAKVLKSRNQESKLNNSLSKVDNEIIDKEKNVDEFLYCYDDDDDDDDELFELDDDDDDDE